MEQYDLSTLLIHGGKTTDDRTGAVNIPIYQTSTFRQERLGGNVEWEYSRSGNPTRHGLETLIADIEKGTHGYAFSSGLAALNAVFSLLQAGDEVVISRNVYGGTFRLLDQVFQHFHLSYRIAQGETVEDFAHAITDATKLILLETPANPLLSITDIRRVSEYAHQRGAKVVVDNTFMTPYLQQPLELGADIVVHSATKYLGGHSDLIAGLVVVRDEELAQRIAFVQNAAGAILSPFDSFLLIRGIKTLGVRMDRHSANALKIAQELESHPCVGRVYYPGLPSHDGYDVHVKQASQAGGMLSFELTDDCDYARFFEYLDVVALAESLGGVESLACHPSSMTHASIPSHLRKEMGISDSLIRLSVGIENVEDILNDVLYAIEKSRK